MATSNVGAGSIGSITTEKNLYRRYVQLDVDEATGKTVIKKERVLIQSDGTIKVKQEDGSTKDMPASWANAEKDGFTLFSENEFITYSVKSIDGFKQLVPSEEHQLYLINIGLSNVQTARAQAAMKADKENSPEPTPEFDQATIDLAVGTDDEGSYSLNRAPSRRSASETDKLIKQFKAMGITDEAQIAAILTKVLEAKQSLASQSEQPEQEEVEASA